MMRRCIVLLLMFPCLAMAQGQAGLYRLMAGAVSGGAISPGTDNLEVLWDFPSASIGSDTSGNSRNLTAYGAVVYSDPIRGDTAYFDGVNDYMEITSFDLDGFSDWSVSFWVSVYDPQPSSYPKALSFGERSVGGITAFTLNGALLSGYGAFHTNTTSDTFISYGTAIPMSSAWTHLVMTYDGSTHEAITYLNGYRYTTYTKYYYANVLNKLVLGKQANAANQYFKGYLDLIKIYSKVLTPENVLYLSGE